ncbi:hypothetical protein [Thalassobellus suaedae]|uniref:Uncharacterized protein n=1 Tax=Thalassobellus suaedae TaxID=3074124 RepID=A0ABY9Y1W7_9FLAO|nr:hypothetical protein RHP49_15060 [Flavobacteriaceae bacterium HL-DH10]
MKRTVLLFAGLLVGLTTASAKTLTINNITNNLNKTKHYRNAEPITFVERGVEFLIFPDGSFDFNTNINNNQNNIYYKSDSKRSSVNRTYSSRNTSIQYTSNYNRGVNIIRDRNGKVRRIGNVFLNYDRYGKITRAGNVFMNYNRGRNNTLTQVGGLHVNYNRWGEIINIRGQVNPFNTSCNTGYSNNNTHQNNNWDNNNYYEHDNKDSYYFKQNGKVKKQKKNK